MTHSPILVAFWLSVNLSFLCVSVCVFWERQRNTLYVTYIIAGCVVLEFCYGKVGDAIFDSINRGVSFSHEKGVSTRKKGGQRAGGRG